MRKAYLAIICLFTGFNAFAQHTDIQPVPQQISESGQLITLPGKKVYVSISGKRETKPSASLPAAFPIKRKATIFVSTIKKSYWQEMMNEEHSMPCRLSATC